MRYFLKVNRIFSLILKYKLLLFLFQKYKMSKFSRFVIMLNIKDVNFTANIKVYIYIPRKKNYIMNGSQRKKLFPPYFRSECNSFSIRWVLQGKSHRPLMVGDCCTYGTCSAFHGHN